MGLVNSLPVFSTGTKVIANVKNQFLGSSLYQPPPHRLYVMAAAVKFPKVGASTQGTSFRAVVKLLDAWDQSLPTTGDPLRYIGIFVANFIALAQEPHFCRVL